MLFDYNYASDKSFKFAVNIYARIYRNERQIAPDTNFNIVGYIFLMFIIKIHL